MPRSRRTNLLALIYLLVISAGLLMPKSADLGQSSKIPFFRTFHLALYAPIGLDMVSNTFLFVPGMLILIYIFPKIPPLIIFGLCSLGSVITELLQLGIPGRVSSLLDVLLNITGMLITLLLLVAFPKALQRLREIRKN